MTSAAFDEKITVTNGVSVVIPVYHTDPAQFNACLKSVVKQANGTFPVEAIVVFDGPPSSELRTIADSCLGDFLSQVIEIEKKGVSAARNVGIRNAHQSWISFLDSDDELPEGSLALLLDFALRTSADVVMGDHVAVLAGGLTEKHQYSTNIIEPSLEFAERLRHDSLRPNKAAGLAVGKLYRKDLLEKEPISFNEHLTQGEDTEFVFKVLQRTNAIGYAHAIVYRYKRNARSAVRAFREDYADRIALSMNAMRLQIDRLPNSVSYEREYAGYVLFHLLLIMVHYLFNPEAPWTAGERKRRYKEVLRLKLFVDAFERYDSADFSFTRKVSLFSLKHRLYGMSRAIARVRQHQIGG